MQIIKCQQFSLLFYLLVLFLAASVQAPPKVSRQKAQQTEGMSREVVQNYLQHFASYNVYLGSDVYKKNPENDEQFNVMLKHAIGRLEHIGNSFMASIKEVLQGRTLSYVRLIGPGSMSFHLDLYNYESARFDGGRANFLRYPKVVQEGMAKMYQIKAVYQVALLTIIMDNLKKSMDNQKKKSKREKKKKTAQGKAQEIHENPKEKAQEVHGIPKDGIPKGKAQEVHEDPKEKTQKVHEDPKEKAQKVHEGKTQEIHEVAKEKTQGIYGISGEKTQGIYGISGEKTQGIHGISGENTTQEVHGISGEKTQGIHEVTRDKAQGLHGIPKEKAQEVHEDPKEKAQEVHEDLKEKVQGIHEEKAQEKSQDIHKEKAKKVHEIPKERAQEVHEGKAEEVREIPKEKTQEILEGKGKAQEEVVHEPPPPKSAVATVEDMYLDIVNDKESKFLQSRNILPIPVERQGRGQWANVKEIPEAVKPAAQDEVTLVMLFMCPGDLTGNLIDVYKQQDPLLKNLILMETYLADTDEHTARFRALYGNGKFFKKQKKPFTSGDATMVELMFNKKTQIYYN